MITVFGVIYMRIKNQMQKEATKRGCILLPIIYLLIGTAFLCFYLFTNRIILFTRIVLF